MRNLLALLAFALLTFAGVGWYLDWYKFRSTASPDGHRHLNIDIHSKKIGEDLHKGSETIYDFWGKRRKSDASGTSAGSSGREDKSDL
jgi:hypothetical protein